MRKKYLIVTCLILLENINRLEFLVSDYQLFKKVVVLFFFNKIVLLSFLTYSIYCIFVISKRHKYYEALIIIPRTVKFT